MLGFDSVRAQEKNDGGRPRAEGKWANPLRTTPRPGSATATDCVRTSPTTAVTSVLARRVRASDHWLPRAASVTVATCRALLSSTASSTTRRHCLPLERPPLPLAVSVYTLSLLSHSLTLSHYLLTHLNFHAALIVRFSSQAMSTPTLQHATLLAGTVSLAFTDEGKGAQTYLLLHGGAGPFSMQSLASSLVSHGSRVIVPVHPGFAGQPRPERFTRMDDLALTYLALLDHLHLSAVVVVGNSMGGWLAAELALRRSPLIRAAVLLNASGVDTAGTELKIVDPTAVPPQERAGLSMHNPGKFSVLPPGPDGMAAMMANQKALRVYCGETLLDPTLKERLGSVEVPTLVLWGQSDRIVTEEYGRRFAGFIPKAQFTPIAEAGHFPQVEQVEKVTALITVFSSTAGQTVQQ